MWDSRDNQEVGLEAAILERKRNSSLVKPSCAEDVPGLKPRTEAAGFRLEPVAERSVRQRRSAGRPAGGIGSANADMSSEQECERHSRRKSKGSCARLIRAG